MEFIAAAMGVTPPREQQREDVSPPQMAESKTAQIANEDIAKLAYALWQQRRYTEGASEYDWLEAERVLREAQAPAGR